MGADVKFQWRCRCRRDERNRPRPRSIPQGRFRGAFAVLIPGNQVPHLPVNTGCVHYVSVPT